MVKCFCGEEFVDAKQLYPHLMNVHGAKEMLRYISDPEGVVKEYEFKSKQ